MDRNHPIVISLLVDERHRFRGRERTRTRPIGTVSTDVVYASQLATAVLRGYETATQYTDTVLFNRSLLLGVIRADKNHRWHMTSLYATVRRYSKILNKPYMHMPNFPGPRGSTQPLYTAMVSTRRTD